MGKSRRCDICNIDISRKSFAKHLGCRKHLKNDKQKKGYTRMVISKTC